jgi:hypothetical protein
MVPGSGRNWIAGQPKFNNPTSTKLKTKNMKTLHLKHSINRSSLRLGLLLIPLALVCFAFLPTAQAVNPAPDGVYPGANTAEGGASALFSLTTGTNNTAIGVQTLYFDTSGSWNTAVGWSALFSNTSGLGNTAIGYQALADTHFISGFLGSSLNTAVGTSALHDNTNGAGNTAVGFNALASNTTGNGNVAVGLGAGTTVQTGNNNIYIGQGVGAAAAAEHDTTRIRNIYGSTATVRAVFVNSDNKLGTMASTRRVKDDIKPMEKASEALLALKPVTFRYKKEVDPTRSLSFGLIAEEVAQVDPNLVTLDQNGKPETVRYEAVNAMLLNEFLKEHSTVQELKKEIAALTAMVKEQAAQIQKVSAQVQMSKPSRQMVANDQ